MAKISMQRYEQWKRDQEAEQRRGQTGQGRPEPKDYKAPNTKDYEERYQAFKKQAAAFGQPASPAAIPLREDILERGRSMEGRRDAVGSFAQREAAPAALLSPSDEALKKKYGSNVPAMVDRKRLEELLAEELERQGTQSGQPTPSPDKGGATERGPFDWQEAVKRGMKDLGEGGDSQPYQGPVELYPAMSERDARGLKVDIQAKSGGNVAIDYDERPHVQLDKSNRKKFESYYDFPEDVQELEGQTMTYWSQTIGDKQGNQLLLTPIKQDGTVMSQSELNKYAKLLLEGGIDKVKDNDRYGLVMGVFAGGTEEENIRRADEMAEMYHVLHESQMNARTNAQMLQDVLPPYQPKLPTDPNIEMMKRVAFARDTKHDTKAVQMSKYTGMYALMDDKQRLDFELGSIRREREELEKRRHGIEEEQDQIRRGAFHEVVGSVPYTPVKKKDPSGRGGSLGGGEPLDLFSGVIDLIAQQNEDPQVRSMALEDELKKLSEREQMLDHMERQTEQVQAYQAVKEKYAPLRENGDFAQKSKFDEKMLSREMPDFMGSREAQDLHDVVDIYAYLNSSPEERIRRVHQVTVPGQVVTDPYELRGLDQMSEDEIQEFNYLFNTQSVGAAKQYLDDKKEGLLQLRAWQQQERMEGLAKESPMFGFLAPRAMNLIKGAFAPTQLLATATGASHADPIFDINRKSSTLDATNMQAASKWFGGAKIPLLDKNIGEGLYGIASSMADAALSIGSGRVLGGVKWGNAFTQTIMSTAVAGDTFMQSLERGLSPAQSVTLGMSAGLVEAATEKWSLEAMFSPVNRKPWLHLFKNMFAEESEEFASSLANRVMDEFVAADQSEVKTNAARIAQEKHISMQEATRIARMDWIKEVGVETLSGALSGALFAVPGMTSNAVQSRREGRTISRDNSAGQLAELAMGLGEGSVAAQEAAKLGDKPSIGEIGNVARIAREELTQQMYDTSDYEARMAVVEQIKELNELTLGTVEAEKQKIEAVNRAMEAAMQDRAEREERDRRDHEEYLALVERLNSEKQGLEVPETVRADIKELEQAPEKQVHFVNAFELGFHGLDKSKLMSVKGMLSLGNEKAMRAFELGSEAFRQRLPEMVRRGAETQAQMPRAGKGRVSFDDSINRDVWSNDQRKQVEHDSAVAEILGLDLYYYQSGTNEAGQFTAANGIYRETDGSIWVDVNAGRQTNVLDEQGNIDWNKSRGDALIGFAMSHEYTHHLIQTNPQLGQAYTGFVLEELIDKKIDVGQLIDAKLKRAENNGRKISFAEAINEVVADGSEGMLQDARVMQKMAEKQPGLFKHVKEWILNYARKLRDVFGKFSPQHYESMALAGVRRDGIHYSDRLVEMYTQMMAADTAARSGEKQPAKVTVREAAAEKRAEAKPAAVKQAEAAEAGKSEAVRQAQERVSRAEKALADAERAATDNEAAIKERNDANSALEKAEKRLREVNYRYGQGEILTSDLIKKTQREMFPAEWEAKQAAEQAWKEAREESRLAKSDEERADLIAKQNKLMSRYFALDEAFSSKINQAKDVIEERARTAKKEAVTEAEDALADANARVEAAEKAYEQSRKGQYQAARSDTGTVEAARVELQRARAELTKQQAADAAARSGEKQPAKVTVREAAAEKRAEAKPAAVKQAEAAEAPVIAGAVMGSAGQVFTADNKPVRFYYAAVPAGSVIASNNTDMTPNPRFKGEQPRDTNRDASRAWVNRVGGHELNYARVADSPEVNGGAPVVDKDLVVQVGNHRAIATQKALQDGRDVGRKYTEDFKRDAARLGIDAKQIQGDMMLVRVQADADQGLDLALAGNDPTTQRYGDTETAGIDAKRMTPAMLDLADMSGGEIDTAGNARFISRFISEVVPKAERGMMLDGDGRLSRAGEARIRNALFQLAYGDGYLTEQMAEATDPDSRNMLRAMTGIAARLAAMNADMKRGLLHEMDIGGEIAEAYRTVLRQKMTGRTVEEYLAQTSMLGEIKPSQKLLLAMFSEYKNSAKKMTGALDSVLDALEEAGDPRQVGLLDVDVKPSAAGVISEGLRNFRAELEEQQAASERFNSENADIRFSMRETVEETRDLIAVHNLNEQKLRDVIGLGGFPMPSIAVTKAEMGHNDFGNISVVFRKEAIDPKRHKDNRIYSQDAWTPTFPRVGYKISEAAADALSARLQQLVPGKEAKNDIKYDFYPGSVDDMMSRGGLGQHARDSRYIQAYATEHNIALPDGAENWTNWDAVKWAEGKQIDFNNVASWLDGLMEETVEKKGIWKGADIFTPSGNRRGWSGLYADYTLDNIVKAMKKESETGASAFSDALTAAGDRFSSIKQMKGESSRIQTVENYTELKSTLRDRLYEAAQTIAGKDKSFQRVEGVLNEFKEAAQNRYRTADQVSNFLNRISNQYQLDYNVNPDAVQEFVAVMNEARNLPVQYFEAKPRRAMPLYEVAAMVVPEGTSADLTRPFTEMGIEVQTYEPGNKADRTEKLNNLDKWKFSERQRDYLSKREVLAGAFDQVARTESEKQQLKSYKRLIRQLNRLESEAAQLRTQNTEERRKKGGADKALISERAGKISEIEERIDAADRRLLKMQDAAPLRNVLKRETEKVGKAARQEAQTQKKEQLDKWRQAREDNAERRGLVNSITKTAETMRKWITEPNPKTGNYVPDMLVKPLGILLEGIDLQSKRALNGGERTSADKAFIAGLDAMANRLGEYQANAASEDGAVDFYLDLPQNIVQTLRQLSEAMGKLAEQGGSEGFVINQMSNEQLGVLEEVLSVLRTSIRTVNQTHTNQAFAHVSEAAESSISELEGMKKKGRNSQVMKFFNWLNMTPVYAFERMGSAAKSFFDAMRDGADKLSFLVADEVEFAKKAFTGKEAKAWAEEIHSFTVNGQEIRMPATSMMSIYLLARRAQARGHLEGEGIRIANFKEGGRTVDQGGVIINGTNFISQVEAALSPRQKAAAEAMQRRMTTTGAALGNEVSMKRFGTRMFTEQDYFPIEVDSDVLGKPKEEGDRRGNNMFALLNLSATKQLTKNANNRLVVRNVFDVYADHMTDMMRYNSMALPILDMIKWYNYRNVEKSADGDITGSRVLKSALRGSFGDGAVSYVRRILENANGSDMLGTPDRLANKMLGRYNRAAVAANLRVALLQPTAYMKAGVYLDGLSLGQAVIKNTTRMKQNIAEMEKNSGIALWKQLGFYDLNISNSVQELIKRDGTMADKISEATMWLPGMMDRITWATLWQATKDNVTRSRKDLKPGTAEHMEAVKAKFRDMVYKTQVVDSVLTRSEFMRNTSFAAKSFSSFLSEGTQAYNMVMDAVHAMTDETSRGLDAGQAWSKHKGKIIRTMSVYALTAVVTGFVEALMDAYRDDDEYHTFMEKVAEALKSNAFENLLPTSIPVVNDLMEGAKRVLSKLGVDTFGFEDQGVFTAGMSYLEDAIEQYQKWQEAQANGSASGYQPYSWIYKLFQAASVTTGMPIANLSREGISAWNNIMQYVSPEHVVKKFKSQARGYDALYKAVETGDREKETMVRAILDRQGASDKDILSQIKTRTGADYRKGRIDEEKAAAIINAQAGADPDDTYWDIKKWGTGENKYTAYIQSIKTGENARKVMEEYLNNGVTAQTLGGEITDEFKAEYVALVLAGKKADAAALKGRLLNAYVLLGYDREKKNKDIDKWVTDAQKKK